MNGPSRLSRWGGLLLVAALVVAATAFSLWHERQATGSTLGFPLDDAWIHMAFGRNLAWGLGFGAQPGEPSTASTSLAWTLWVALLHLLLGRFGLAAVVWAVKASCLGFALLALWGAFRILDEASDGPSSCPSSSGSPVLESLSSPSPPGDPAIASTPSMGASPIAPSPNFSLSPSSSGFPILGPLPPSPITPAISSAPSVVPSPFAPSPSFPPSPLSSGVPKVPSSPPVQPFSPVLLALLLVATAYPLAWAGLSGMEVPATIAACTWALRWHLVGCRSPEADRARRLAAFLWGVAAVLRPENLALLVGMTVLLARHEPRGRAAGLARLAPWGLAVVAGQALFYLAVGGNPFPSTLAAKMTGRALPMAWQAGGLGGVLEALVGSPFRDLAEVAGFAGLECPVLLLGWLALPLAFRHWRPGTEPTAPAGEDLPSLWTAWAALPLVSVLVGWVAGPEFLTLFHGRYVAHTLWLSALAGLALALSRFSRTPVPVAVLAMLLVGAAYGVFRQVEVAREYGREVATINALQVAWAQWFRQTQPPGCRVALNDVGAMAYFGRQRLIDLEGLITPSSIPWRRQGTIDRFLEQEKPDFLLIFPYWYPEVTRRLDFFQAVLKRSVPFNPTGGGEELVLFTMPWTARPPGGWPRMPPFAFPGQVPDPGLPPPAPLRRP